MTDFNLALVATLCKLILPLHRLAQAYSQRYKVGYIATPIVYGWAGAVIKITCASGQEQWALQHRESEKGTNLPTD